MIAKFKTYFLIFTLLISAILTGAAALADEESDRPLGAKYIPLVSSNNIAFPFPSTTSSIFEPEHGAFRQATPYFTQLSSGFDIPVVLNTVIWEELDSLQRRPGRVKTMLERGSTFIPTMKKALFDEGCPLDMVFLAMIESGFSPTARSPMNATGLWQFMESTGRLYGLEKNLWIDERMDIEKSSHAAARFLLDLYDRFGDWSLVLAAYNAGPGTVSSAIKKEKTTDFWKIASTQRLRAETKSFVPRFYATLFIAKYPERFGLALSSGKSVEDEYATVKAPPLTDMIVISKLSGVSYDQLMLLNAQYVYECTPPDPDHGTVRVPKKLAKGLQEKLDALDKENRNYFFHYEVKKHDTLERIARSYHVKPNMILEANELSSRREIHAGMILTVPIRKKLPEREMRPPPAPTVVRENPAVRKTSSGMYCVHYTVGNGETLWEIANTAGVDIEELCNWNDLNRSDTIQPGQSLIIYCDNYNSALKLNEHGNDNQNRRMAGKSSSSRLIYHTIMPGESLYNIATKYRVSVNNIADWNDISDPRRVRAGRRLKIYRQ